MQKWLKRMKNYLNLSWQLSGDASFGDDGLDDGLRDVPLEVDLQVFFLRTQYAYTISKRHVPFWNNFDVKKENKRTWRWVCWLLHEAKMAFRRQSWLRRSFLCSSFWCCSCLVPLACLVEQLSMQLSVSSKNWNCISTNVIQFVRLTFAGNHKPRAKTFKLCKIGKDNFATNVIWLVV